ncbi:glutamate-rich protein 5 isoform X2 [Phoca vitulina]|uniref:glutamate-rich protein 5 isoform X2 n=1 Tax=Phoca vitulina TaxID=9720 RepID=UPI001396120A|nr:glutamate-rich protein 5 isoform X2 [Phoca vitulina]
MGCSSSALNKAGDSSKPRSGETGEKVEAEMENDKGSEGPGTKEEETGEAVDLSVAT